MLHFAKVLPIYQTPQSLHLSAKSGILVEYWALPENSVVGPRASDFSPGKDGEAGDIGFIVDVRLRRRCSQADNRGCLYPTVAALAA